MSRYPAAEWRPVTRYLPGGSSARTSPGQRRLIFHTAVTSATSLFGAMSVPGTPTSHFYVDATGRVEQYINTAIESSANLEGNHDCITVETQDKGPMFAEWSGSNVPAWTDAQVEALARLAVWCVHEHGIPLEPLPSSRPGTRGVGWHRLGIDGSFPPGILGGRDPGGEVWSTSAGKACPGDRRIMQTVQSVIPRARQIISPSEEDDMQLTDKLGPDDDAPTVREALRAAISTQKALANFRQSEAGRAKAFRQQLAAIADDLDDNATKEQVAKARAQIRALRDELNAADETEGTTP